MRTTLTALALALVTGCTPAMPGQTPASTVTTAVTASASAAPSVTPSPAIWQPRPGTSWHIQYAGELAATAAEVVDVDGHETSAATVARLKAEGKRVICYVNAGGWEDWRPDRDRFPREIIGRPLDDWPGERWLDIRKPDVLLPILAARMDECARKGFDAVDPDNLDGWQADTGFPLKPEHTLAYVRALSAAAHARGLAIGLKNAVELIPRAEPLVEFAVNEECLAYAECGSYAPLLAAGKAVFHIEYTGSIDRICARVPAGFSTVRKHLALDAWSQSC